MLSYRRINEYERPDTPMSRNKHEKTDLEILAELDEICHALVHVALDQRLALLCQALLLVLDEVAEGRERIRGGLAFAWHTNQQ